MKELADASRKINKILHEAENEGVGYDATLAKLNEVKVHGVVFPTLMLMEIIEKFLE